MAKMMSECWHENPAARLSMLRVKKTLSSLMAATTASPSTNHQSRSATVSSTALLSGSSTQSLKEGGNSSGSSGYVEASKLDPALMMMMMGTAAEASRVPLMASVRHGMNHYAVGSAPSSEGSGNSRSTDIVDDRVIGFL